MICEYCGRDTKSLLEAEEPDQGPGPRIKPLCSEDHVAFVKPLIVAPALGISLPGSKF